MQLHSEDEHEPAGSRHAVIECGCSECGSGRKRASVGSSAHSSTGGGGQERAHRQALVVTFNFIQALKIFLGELHLIQGSC